MVKQVTPILRYKKSFWLRSNRYFKLCLLKSSPFLCEINFMFFYVRLAFYYISWLFVFRFISIHIKRDFFYKTYETWEISNYDSLLFCSYLHSCTKMQSSHISNHTHITFHYLITITCLHNWDCQGLLTITRYNILKYNNVCITEGCYVGPNSMILHTAKGFFTFLRESVTDKYSKCI